MVSLILISLPSTLLIVLTCAATGAAAPATPKKGKATPLKRGKKAQVDVEEESDDDTFRRVMKKARKSSQKKVKSEPQGDEADDEASSGAKWHNNLVDA